MTDLMKGASPLSLVGNELGILVLHGFTGNPQSVRPLADGFASEGFSVEMPLLSGHGTVIEDMVDTGWSDWAADAEAALARLGEHSDKQVVAGLSMGGSLAIWLATRHPELCGLICVNPAVRASAEIRAAIEGLIDSGEEVLDAIGSDVADPNAPESAYNGTPLRPLLSMFEAADRIVPTLRDITCPLLLFTSPQDHVVSPTDSDFLADSVSVPVERVSCDRSYHVATLDYDRQMVIERSVDFVARVTAD